MKSNDQRLLEEAYANVRYKKGPGPTDASYIYFKDTDELYSIKPFGLITDEGIVDRVKKYGKTYKVSVGEDVFGNSCLADQIRDAIVW